MSIGFVFRSVPHGSNSGREGLDAVLATSAYSEEIQLFFIGDGVWQLLKGQQGDQVLSREYSVAFKMLSLYDIEDIWVCGESLSKRGLSADDLLIDAEVLGRDEFSHRLHRCQKLLSY
ncbi:sulfurtransferase complex subunit TusC [Photobacterium sp. CCB-ST2H9]|uniref:sulfurtransferase complex subunit TusC n=1 Tax=Photobacterium sp. CCB-ST2H9 TaxID=2912855 RepID=UPI0020051501|nr:sulfurtransferase complex subunit TusC [Photobacterium sp. CCB-ST2H9]UTM57591.1 sulfurtransferase complex subunit TusC [Photobacterium sp. CCB-ST2H9]